MHVHITDKVSILLYRCILINHHFLLLAKWCSKSSPSSHNLPLWNFRSTSHFSLNSVHPNIVTKMQWLVPWLVYKWYTKLTVGQRYPTVKALTKFVDTRSQTKKTLPKPVTNVGKKLLKKEKQQQLKTLYSRYVSRELRPGNKTKLCPRNHNKKFSHCHMTGVSGCLFLLLFFFFLNRRMISSVVLMSLFFPEKITGTVFYFSSFVLQEVFSCRTEDFFLCLEENSVTASRHTRGKPANQFHPRLQVTRLSLVRSLDLRNTPPLDQGPSPAAWIIPTQFANLFVFLSFFFTNRLLCSLFSVVQRHRTAAHRNTPPSQIPSTCVNSCTPTLHATGKVSGCGNQPARNPGWNPQSIGGDNEATHLLVNETSSPVVHQDQSPPCLHHHSADRISGWVCAQVQVLSSSLCASDSCLWRTVSVTSGEHKRSPVAMLGKVLPRRYHAAPTFSASSAHPGSQHRQQNGRGQPTGSPR